MLVNAIAYGKGRYTKPEAGVVPGVPNHTKARLRLECDKPELSIMDRFTGTMRDSNCVKQLPSRGIQVKIHCDVGLRWMVEHTSDDDPAKPDLLLQTADKYFEQHRFYRFKAGDLNLKIAEAREQDNTQRVAQLETQQKDFRRREMQWAVEGVKQYRPIADGPKFQSFQKMDQVLFSLIYLLMATGEKEAALTVFDRLRQNYPQSEYVPYAYATEITSSSSRTMTML
jgi:hypothetical protein